MADTAVPADAAATVTKLDVSLEGDDTFEEFAAQGITAWVDYRCCLMHLARACP